MCTLWWVMMRWVVWNAAVLAHLVNNTENIGRVMWSEQERASENHIALELMFSLLFTRCAKAIHFTLLLYLIILKFIMKPHHNGLYIPVSNIYGGVFLQKLLTNKIHEIFLQKGSIIDDTQCSKFACASFFFSSLLSLNTFKTFI